MAVQAYLRVECPECGAEHMSLLTTTEVATGHDAQRVAVVDIVAFADMDTTCECGTRFGTPGAEDLTIAL